jgi:Spy/CpxP family protein refolding chaperone
MSKSTSTVARRPLRLVIATVVVALAGGLTLTASAQPMGDMHGMRGMREGMGGPMMMERMLDSVNASTDQRAQIQQIMQAAHADVQAQHQQMQTLHQQGRALFAQPNVDARAAETLRQQELALHDQTSKRMLQARLDASAVLTPAQRQTLAAKLAQRQALMERQRAERAALDKSATR